jgi:hypothetical protein
LLSALVHIPLLFLAGLSGKQKKRTSSLRAQRLCGENEYQNGPLLGVVFDCLFFAWGGKTFSNLDLNLIRLAV